MVKVLHNGVVLLLLIIIEGFKLSVFLTEASQFLDFRGELLLLVFDLIFNLDHDCCDLLESLFLLVVKYLVRLRYTLDLVLHVGVARDSLLLLKALHELI